MTDIVERLRSLSEGRIPLAWSGWVLEAADQIEGLRDELRNAYRERDDASRDWEQAMRRVSELEQQLASRAVPDCWGEPVIATPTDERKEFEAWAKRFYNLKPTTADILMARTDAGEYHGDILRNGWRAWQARARLAAHPQSVREGE